MQAQRIRDMPVARLDFLGNDGTICSSFEYASQHGFQKDLEEALHYGEPVCIALYRDENGSTISRDFLERLDTLPVGMTVEDNPYLKHVERSKER